VHVPTFRKCLQQQQQYESNPIIICDSVESSELFGGRNNVVTKSKTHNTKVNIHYQV
jgi:hypothetical protein